MVNAEFVNSKDVRDQSVAANGEKSTASLVPSNNDMSQFGDIVKSQQGALAPLLPEFTIDTTDIYAPPVISTPDQVDCSRYDVVAANPSDDQVVKDLLHASSESAMAKINVAFQNDYNQGAFESFQTIGGLSLNQEPYLDVPTMVDQFNNAPALTIDEFHGGQFLYNNQDILKSADGLIHQEGLDNWYKQTISNIDSATAQYKREVLECINNDF